MKYMGSKRLMLQNGLSKIIEREMVPKSRFVDLFTGSGAVAWHVAERYEVSVLAVDLQQYATSLADGIISRSTVSGCDWIDGWIEKSLLSVASQEQHISYKKLQERIGKEAIETVAGEGRRICVDSSTAFCRAYGGYYYSPYQASVLSALRENLPNFPEYRAIAISALIQTASQCAAAPGHTAQAFKPNTRAGKYLVESWLKDVETFVRANAKATCGRHAKVIGESHVGDALEVAKSLTRGDLVFIDPPYSSVHYSRFYHVLETVATGDDVEVTGEGRYPPTTKRPRSSFSVPSEAQEALAALFRSVSVSGASAIVTFPANLASNGLSGDMVRKIASDAFTIEAEEVASRFSTLGGNRTHRAARQDTQELILALRPR